jgi:ribonuclease HIII
LDAKEQKELEKAGVRDSKKITDNRIKLLAKLIEKKGKYYVVKISPEKYNRLYINFKNMNKILAWAHITALENLLKNVKNHETIIIDKFASDDRIIEDMLKKKKLDVKVVQKNRAESETAVAAASIIARAEFLKTLRKLSYEIGYRLPRGSTHVGSAMEYIKKNYEPDVLPKVAKLHFRFRKPSKKS